MNRSLHCAAAGLVCAAGLLASGSQVRAGPAYDHDRKELESILEDLAAWWPGEWSNAPQIWYQRNVRMPEEGEHEPWYRTFARIDAPQVGRWVFYGQINIGGREGPLYGRSQVIYKASIDEERGVVLVRGQALMENPERFINLQDHPERWKELRFDEEAVRCDFIWRRNGSQIVGILDGRTPESRVGGPGTCTYTNPTGKTFFADAEWTLTPETLWLYDINTLDGIQFIGRKDRTHSKLSRSHPFRCDVRDLAGQRSFSSYDRGGWGELTAADGKKLRWRLLRARYPAADGFGLEEQLRLTIHEPDSEPALSVTSAPASARRIALAARGARVSCVREAKFGPMPADP